MAIKKIDIINFGLTLAGSEKLTSLTDSSKEARLTSTFDLIYKADLTLPFNWKFAKFTTELSATTSPTIGGYDYRYILPSKCLRVVKIVDEDDYDYNIPYRRELYVDGSENEFQCVLTNSTPCYIQYLRDLENPATWPAWFAKLVAIDFAIVVCDPLTHDKQKKNQLIVMRDEPNIGWLHRAIQANAMEDSDSNDQNRNVKLGNNDVLQADIKDFDDYRYIIERT